jgi:hypothetical protein
LINLIDKDWIQDISLFHKHTLQNLFFDEAALGAVFGSRR